MFPRSIPELPKSLQDVRRYSQENPKIPRMPLRVSHKHPKSARRGPKRSQEHPQDAPRCPQYVHRRSQRHFELHLLRRATAQTDLQESQAIPKSESLTTKPWKPKKASR